MAAHRHHTFLAALASCAAWGSPAPATHADEVVAEVAAAPMLGDPYPQRKTSFPGGVVSRADVVYATHPGFRPLRLDLYLPSGGKARPLVVYVHGGGWQGGHTRHAGAFVDWPGVLAVLARRGYVVASIEYRLSGEARFPAALDDVKTAVRWLRAHARELGIDRGRVVLWGGSAGGHLAALAATSCDVAALRPKFAEAPTDRVSAASLQQESDCVQGLVAWYGVFDFRTVAISGAQQETDAPPAKFLGCAPQACLDIATLASPITHLDARDPPTLLIHGEDDRVVPIDQSRAFQRALQMQGVRSSLIVLPEVDHSFIGESAASTRAASLEALAATFRFIDAAFGEKRQ